MTMRVVSAVKFGNRRMLSTLPKYILKTKCFNFGFLSGTQKEMRSQVKINLLYFLFVGYLGGRKIGKSYAFFCSIILLSSTFYIL